MKDGYCPSGLTFLIFIIHLDFDGESFLTGYYNLDLTGWLLHATGPDSVVDRLINPNPLLLGDFHVADNVTLDFFNRPICPMVTADFPSTTEWNSHSSNISHYSSPLEFGTAPIVALRMGLNLSVGS
tara:strand:- start:714 stop:1094 length:381 start_codon:yes stop_codon:yes gene_type:complete